MATNCNKEVIGIDLGTTTTCVAALKNNNIVIIANDAGYRTFPSVVCFSDEGRKVGQAAKHDENRFLTNTICEIKRIIGSKFSDEATRQQINNWPFEVISDSKGNPKIQVLENGSTLSLYPEQISGIVLQHVKQYGENYLGHEIKDVVITVPAYFNDHQRSATRDAAKIAGLNVIKMINEPTAAALTFGYENSSNNERILLVYDLGGGTFDVSIVSIQGTNYKVIATSGDTHLGGMDFRNRLLDHLLTQIKEKLKIDIKDDRVALRRLSKKCENTKEKLSIVTQKKVELDSIYNNKDANIVVTRSDFERINIDLFRNTIDIVAGCIKDAGMTKDNITDIILVGGSSRIPKIQELLKEYFNGKKLLQTVNPEEAIAYGAAIQAALLKPQLEFAKVIKIMEVTPLSLGVKTNTGEMEILIKRNTQTPCVGKKTFITPKDNMTYLKFDIYQGERLLAKENVLLGTLKIDKIPPRPAQQIKFRTTFSLDENGILSVKSVAEGLEDFKGSVSINLEENRLTLDNVKRLVKIAEEKKEDDTRLIKFNRMKDDVQLYCLKVLQHMKDNPKRIDNKTKTKIVETCNNGIKKLKQFQYRFEMEELLEKIQNICEPYLKTK